MRRLFSLLAILVALAGPLTAATAPVVRVVALSPDPADRLADGQNLSVRIAYESDQPLRFQLRGYLQGQPHQNEGFNPSPAYPAGKGEAIVWLFAQAGTRLDEVRIQVSDSRWQRLSEVPVSVQAVWRAGVTPGANAPWVKELNDAAQRIPQPAPPPESLLQKIWVVLAMVLVPVCFLCTPAYPLLQVYTLWKLRGPSRLLSALPLTFMVPVYAYSAYALTQESNLWPLFALFSSPVAFIIALTVFLVARRRARAATPAP